ncbi:hypothetical protein CXT96_06485 [Akkermansia muciniphila]|nr:hypothetical protein CXT92_01630 [Akkermansia muciniphila]PNC91570.1 hypothetical protein CXT91_06870 [Akkermansia muciniphila]PND14014.1 hypothetical protein CXT96_06485 [Akkermansia muciniphila]
MKAGILLFPLWFKSRFPVDGERILPLQHAPCVNMDNAVQICPVYPGGGGGCRQEGGDEGANSG